MTETATGPSPHELGFAHPMPGMTGEVAIVSPEHEQLSRLTGREVEAAVPEVVPEFASQEFNLSDDPTLIESEWAEAVKDKVTNDVMKIRASIDEVIQARLAPSYEADQTDKKYDLGEVEKGLLALRPHLYNPILDIESASLMADLFLDVDQLRVDITGRSGYGISCQMLELLPSAHLRQLYFESGKWGESNLADRMSKFSDRDIQLRLITKIYGDQKDELGYADDSLAQIVERYFGDNEAERRIALLPEMPRDSNESSVAEFNRHITREMSSILREIGLPKDLTLNYAISAQVRTMNGFPAYQELYAAPGAIYSFKVKRELASIAEVTKDISVERITQLYEHLGVENLWAYTSWQLKDMIDLLDGDPHTINYFKSGDVTVEFVDARNDWNGAAITESEEDVYLKPSGRTLRFEVAQPSDIYRRMLFLQKLGIKPSTMVYSAHGQPGLAGMGDPRLWQLASYDSSFEGALSVARSQFGRVVRDFMQPNRGIDSAPENIGRVQIILNTCDGDVPMWHEGIEYPSMAEAIAKPIGDELVGRDDVDIYAAPGRAFDSEENGRMVFNVSTDPEDDESPVIQAMNRLTPESRGGLPGYPKKTVIRRRPVDGVSVRKASIL